MSKLHHKILASVIGAFIGASLVFAQVPGPVNLRGTGGNTIQEVIVPSYGTGGTFTSTPIILTGTGGTVFTQGPYTIHAFTAGGTFTPPAGLAQMDVLVVAGGGGGGGYRRGGGGGGAGGVLWQTGVAVSLPSYAVTVGTGGNGGANTNNAAGNGSNGTNSSLGAITAIGGGGGLRGSLGNTADAGSAGGSGGGGGSTTSNNNPHDGGNGTGGQGFNGGQGGGSSNGNNQSGGGGGGASQAGQAGSNAAGGNGGDGLNRSAEFPTLGSGGWFGGGGGGGKRSGGSAGTGGQGGGGGGSLTGAGSDATPNTGGGGGGTGGDGANTGGAGASGIVVVRYIAPASGQTRVRHVFTSSGTFTSPAGLSALDVFVVAGGGGGGGYRYGAGGGGAGGLRWVQGQAVAASTPYTVTVGAGGAAGTTANAVAGDGQNGGNSSFGVLVTATGGGGGQRGDRSAAGGGGAAGGSGGGGGSNDINATVQTGGNGTVGQGNNGGAGRANTTDGNNRGGGGGGAGGTGGTGTDGAGSGGAGGVGQNFSATFGTGVGQSGWFAGGGGGGKRTTGTGGAGGQGGGGAGNVAGNGVAGTANTGGGGGGGGNGNNIVTGGAGGSGIVIIEYIAPSITYIAHTFTASGSFSPPPGVSSVEVLVVGGGGGGGSRHGGGGAGGGLVYHNAFTVTQTPYTVTVGTGGTSGETSPTNGSVGTNGGNSSFGIITALGGGGGGSYTAPAPTGGGSGGGGGGVGGTGAGTGDGAGGNRSGGTANQGASGGGTGFGFAGGTGAGPGVVADLTGGGGGGGAGGAGAIAVGHLGGTGGVGRSYNFTGSTTFYSGGGGGGSGGAVANIAAGGNGGGGAGGSLGAPGTAGTANTGGGGGGSRSDGPNGTTASRGGAGGSGVVMVRYLPPALTITQQPSATATGTIAFAQQPIIRLLTAAGAPVVGVNITAAIESGTGTLSGTTTVAPNGSGLAVFTNLTLNGTAGNFRLNFKANGSNEKVVSNNIALTLAPHLEIIHAANYPVCTPSSAVTIQVKDGNGNPLTSYAGLITITNNGNYGNYSAGPGAAPARFNNGTPNNGSATYTMDATDNGQVILNFATATQGNLTFNAVSGSYTTQNYSLVMDVGPCAFHISHGGDSDVCSAEPVTITAVNEIGGTITTFAGTINLSTSTSIGDWSKAPSAQGTLSNFGSGNASYIFNSADNGEVILDFTHGAINPSVNINVISGSSVEVPGIYDPPLAIDACTFQITLSSPNSTACTATTVSIAVFDRDGDPATEYAGLVSLSTTTVNGTWLTTTGMGALIDNNPGNGTGTYTFVNGPGGDMGTVDLIFSDDVVEQVYIIATANAGGITVDSGFDPELNITSCLPAISDVQCYNNQSQVNAITLPSSAAAIGSRMVLMYINSESFTSATGATLNGIAMTPLKTQVANSGIGNTLQVYGMLDANLPGAAGQYDAAFTGSTNGPAMCLVAVEGVEQTFPLEAIPAASGQLNGSEAVSPTDIISTSITTLENNSIVLSVVANGQDGTTYLSSLGSSLWQAGVNDASSSDWAGNWGHQLTAAAVTVSEDPSAVPNRQAHIVLALPPIVKGNPAITSYVPVTLYKTYAGNVNYRTIGNTLRQFGNGSFSCVMFPTATGSTSTLTIPAGSTIREAFLYWAGSGFELDADAAVSFGDDGDGNPDANITADDIFIVDGNQVYNPAYPAIAAGFFAGYKDVTGLITTATSTTYRFSNLNVQVGVPWSNDSTCLGGWSLVVVYENPAEDYNVINLFHGFQPFWHSSFTLVPRNFRMASPDGVSQPRGQITHVTFEGDSNITAADEEFELQNNPATQTFDTLINPPINPADNQYNNTIQFPNYDINLNFNGTYTTSTTSYGVDIDTYSLQGDTMGELLYPFGATEAEQITTRYGTGQDIVLLTGEFISVTNAPIADMEVFAGTAGTFTVDTMGLASYEYTVTNNGNGAVSGPCPSGLVAGGCATGDVILTGNMPTGITINSINAPGWDCALATATAFTCYFDITGSWTTLLGAAINGQLKAGESLPNVSVLLNLANETQFPLLDNDVTTIARMAHVGNYLTCPAEPAGVQPDPNPATGGCSKAAQFDNINDLNKYLIDIDNITEKLANNNNVDKNEKIIRGIETDLRIIKSVSGILEINEPAQYLLTVSNLGPNDTSKIMTVTDTLPSGMVPTLASGTNWTCGIVGQTVTCTRTTPLPVGNSSIITITTGNIAAPLTDGSYPSNSATVTAGQYNFDTNNANNSSTVSNVQVTGPLAAGAEKYLITVSEDGSSIGGLGPFNEGDLVVYDPVTDTAEMFLSEASIPGVTNLGDINALHMLPNGHVVMSTDLIGASINGVTFNPEDLVLYDPILMTATLVFDGSTIFTGAADIDAVFIDYNDSYDSMDWDIVLSTAGTATIGATTFQDNDIVIYSMTSGTVSAVIDGADNDLFNNATGDIAGLYQRYDNANQYVLTTSDLNATIGIAGSDQLSYERGELIEIDLTTPNDPTTDPLFCDDQLPCIGAPPGIFTPASTTRRLDGVHVVESGYFGHFAIASAGGDTCSATSFTISKHRGLTHVVETVYEGSIVISNSLSEGTWAKDVTANGTITPIGPGMARYTFDPADNGEVILFITGTAASTSFNVNITNTPILTTGIGKENSPTEDSNFVISDLVTAITYSDQFSNVAYGNNDGVASFATNWIESNDDGLPGAGKIKIETGGPSPGLRFHNQGGGTPSITRTIDFSGYTVSEPPVLSFNWKLSGNPSGSFVVEARGNSGDGWTTLQTFTTPLSPAFGAVNYTLTDAPFNLTLSATTQIRFRITSGYTASTTDLFTLDNVQITTETNDCGVGDTIDHYSITHSGNMVSCLAENITITPHTIGDLSASPAPGTVLTLSTSNGEGTWDKPLNGTGAFSSVAGSGQATYIYQFGDEGLVFPFYYTDITGNSETFTITVQDNTVPGKIQLENQTMTAARAGLRFYNETLDSTDWPTLVAGLPSNLYPGHVLTVQAIQASDENPSVCAAVFPANTVVPVELAFEMIDRSTNTGAVVSVNVSNNGTNTIVNPVQDDSLSGVNTGGFVNLPLLFENFGTYNAARLVLTYSDVGALQIHGRSKLLEDSDDGNGLVDSGEYMTGSGAPNSTNDLYNYNFVVRPFGYDIDFSQDRKNNYAGDYDAVASWAADASGSKFFAAGANFNTTVSAVAWQCEDDDPAANCMTLTGNFDGVPNTGAKLFDNDVTPNYGNEATATENDMTITHSLSSVMPIGSVAGTLNTATFSAFSANNGTESHPMNYSEVGIIDLVATLDSGNYLDGGESVSNDVLNVGRFVPDHFTVSTTMLTARPLFIPPTATFTYMGEEFTAWFTLTARNAYGIETTTQNYFGDFAKLTTPAQLTFYAVDDVTNAADIDYTTRLSKVVGGSNPLPANFSADWSGGTIALDGNLIFARQLDELPEEPITDLLIAVTVLDTDSVIDSDRNVDLDLCNPDCIIDPEDDDDVFNLIGPHEFRYGRIVLSNGYGSEIAELDDMDVPIGEDVSVSIRVEYWIDNEFIVNEDDIATPYSSAELDFVAATYEENLDAGEALITVGTTGIVFKGGTELLNTEDRPLFLQAPGEGNEGAVIIELDLDALGLSFLKFDWRTTGEKEDIKQDADSVTTTDNPRSYIEFGALRGNDRIINWQELFLNE